MKPRNKERVIAALGSSAAPICDDCLAATAKISSRQTVFQLCTTLAAASRVVRARGWCSVCGKTKKTTQIATAAEALPVMPAGHDTAVHCAVASPDPTTDEKPWYWEGNVQDVLAKFLVSQGWNVTETADTASKEHGIDIYATKAGRWLAVEVKGYPTTTYEYGATKGELKRTRPATQARQWFSHALLTMMQLRHKRPEAEIATCFPDFPTYWRLFAATRVCFEILGFGIYFISADESVRADLAHRPVSGVRSARVS